VATPLALTTVAVDDSLLRSRVDVDGTANTDNDIDGDGDGDASAFDSDKYEGSDIGNGFVADADVEVCVDACDAFVADEDACCFAAATAAAAAVAAAAAASRCALQFRCRRACFFELR
jgi:hypothetical protein